MVAVEPCAMQNSGMAYAPTPNEVKTRRDAAGLTAKQAAELVLVDLRTWQRWEAQQGTEGSRQMSPSHWLLFTLQLEKLAAERGKPRTAKTVR
jgi:hypothetical protein